MIKKLVCATLALGSVLMAHHSVANQFDMSKTITIRGVVTRVEWMNPHARYWVDATNDDGTVSNWEMELPPPNALKRLEHGRLDFIKPGDQVAVNLCAQRTAPDWPIR